MDPLIGASLISGIANLGGGFMSAGGAANANAANMAMNQANINMQRDVNNSNQTFQNNVNLANWAFSREMTDKSQDFAREQMAFQDKESSTAYQRAMADMKAAGLNPMLAYQQGGASTPSGASGNVMGATAQAAVSEAPQNKFAMGNTQEELGRAVGRVASSAVDTYRTGQQARQLSAQTSLTGEQERKIGFETENIHTDSARKRAEHDVLREQEKTERERQGLVRAQAGQANASSASSYADAAYRGGQKAYHDKYGYPGSPGLSERIGRTIQDSPMPQQLPNPYNLPTPTP